MILKVPYRVSQGIFRLRCISHVGGGFCTATSATWRTLPGREHTILPYAEHSRLPYLTLLTLLYRYRTLLFHGGRKLDPFKSGRRSQDLAQDYFCLPYLVPPTAAVCNLKVFTR